MIIRTITCHNVYNYGASLQEYALFYYLKKMGHDVKVIDYQPKYLKKSFSFFNISNNKYKKNILLKALYIIAKIPERIINLQRKKAFDRFSIQNIEKTSKSYFSNHEIKISLPIADVYICGSDQIWNCLFENGKDPAFYLDFAPESSLKISYAASFATDQIDDELKGFVKEMVNNLDFVSVREVSALNILNDINIKHAENVLDPVFLIDKSHWAGFTSDIKDKYIFVYDFDNNKHIFDEAKRMAKKYNFKIYTVNKNITYSHKNFYTKGPEFFLTLIKNAEFVLTNSFHAVAFSLIFHRPFLVFNRQEPINTRMRDLLEAFNLSYLLVEDGLMPINRNVNFDDIEKTKEKLVKISKNFLMKSLNTIN